MNDTGLPYAAVSESGVPLQVCMCMCYIYFVGLGTDYVSILNLGEIGASVSHHDQEKSGGDSSDHMHMGKIYYCPV